jgi:hypothetical protein
MANQSETERQSPKPSDLPAKPSPALETLDALAGEWSYAGSHPALPGAVLRGKTTFEWLEGERFLIGRETIDHPEMPDSISVIGADNPDGPLVQHYFDSRGVSRDYKMSFSDNIWKRWRDDDPGFLQRSTGTLSDDGNTITVRSELSRDGVNWEDDLRITYTKMR